MIRRGRFARWNDKEYRMSSNNRQIYLTTTDVKEIQNGFTHSGGSSGVFAKKVEVKELEDAYEIVPYAMVEGYRFAIESVDVQKRMVKLVTNNTFAAKKLEVLPYGNAEYMIELPIEKITLKEDCIPILGFENNYV